MQYLILGLRRLLLSLLFGMERLQPLPIPKNGHWRGRHSHQPLVWAQLAGGRRCCWVRAPWRLCHVAGRGSATWAAVGGGMRGVGTRGPAQKSLPGQNKKATRIVTDQPGGGGLTTKPGRYSACRVGLKGFFSGSDFWRAWHPSSRWRHLWQDCRFGRPANRRRSWRELSRSRTPTLAGGNGAE